MQKEKRLPASPGLMRVPRDGHTSCHSLQTYTHTCSHPHNRKSASLQCHPDLPFQALLLDLRLYTFSQVTVLTLSDWRGSSWQNPLDCMLHTEFLLLDFWFCSTAPQKSTPSSPPEVDAPPSFPSGPRCLLTPQCKPLPWGSVLCSPSHSAFCSHSPSASHPEVREAYPTANAGPTSILRGHSPCERHTPLQVCTLSAGTLGHVSELWEFPVLCLWFWSPNCKHLS